MLLTLAVTQLQMLSTDIISLPTLYFSQLLLITIIYKYNTIENRIIILFTNLILIALCYYSKNDNKHILIITSSNVAPFTTQIEVLLQLLSGCSKHQMFPKDVQKYHLTYLLQL